MFFDIQSHEKPLELEEQQVPLVTSSKQLLHDSKLQQGFLQIWPTYYHTIFKLKKSIPNVFGGKTGGWLPLVTAYVAGYQTSPRLKASKRTHHNRADTHYFPVLELLQTIQYFGLPAVLGFLDSHPSKSPKADIQYSIHPLRCWGPWLLDWLQLLHWHNYFSSLLRLTRSPHQDTQQMVPDTYQIYMHSHHYYRGGSKPTHLTGITCIFLLSQLFLQGASGLWQFGAKTSPSSEPLFPSANWHGQLRESLQLGMGAHSWAAEICQPWGQYSIQGLTGHNGSPWVFQAPTFHLTEAVG